MGACASIQKAMRGEASEAPVPEPAKEESVKAVENTEEVKDEQEKKIDDDNETKPQLLESFLDKGVEKKASEEDDVKPKEDQQNKAKEEEEKVEAEAAAAPAPAPVEAAPEKAKEEEINKEEKKQVEEN